jgi:hypothetical protein
MSIDVILALVALALVVIDVVVHKAASFLHVAVGLLAIALIV